MSNYEYALMCRIKDSDNEWELVRENSYHRSRSRPRIYPHRHTAQGYLTGLENGSYHFYYNTQLKNDEMEFKLVKRQINEWEDA